MTMMMMIAQIRGSGLSWRAFRMNFASESRIFMLKRKLRLYSNNTELFVIILNVKQYTKYKLLTIVYISI